MSNLLPSFIIYLSVSILFFIILYLTGHFVLSLCQNKDNPTVLFFKKITFGLIIITTIYALFVTSGRSIYIVSAFLLVVVGLISLIKPNLKKFLQQIRGIEARQLTISIVLLCLVFSYAFYFLIYYSEGGTVPDYVFYSNACYLLNSSGVENPISAYLGLSPNTAPYHYHYTQIWLCALVAKTFGLKYYHVLVLVVFSILQIIILVGMAAFLSKIKALNSNIYTRYFYSLLILLIAPITIANSGFEFLHYYHFKSFFDYPKLGEIYVLYILAILYLADNKYVFALLSILFLVPFYTTVTPGILAGSTFVLSFLIIKKKIKYKSGIVSLSLILIVFILTIGFYKIFVPSNAPGGVFNSDVNLFTHLNIDVIWESVRIMGKLIISLIPTLAVLIITILYLLKYKKLEISANKLNLGFLISIFGFSGLVFSSITAAFIRPFNHDSQQILYNFIDPLLAIILFLLIVFFLKTIRNKFLKICTTSLLLLILVVNTIHFSTGMFFIGNNYYSADRKEFQTKVLMSIDDNLPIAFIKDYSRFDITKNPHILLPYMDLPFSELIHLNGYYTPYCISILDIPENAFTQIKQNRGVSFDFRHFSSFGIFVNDQKRNTSFTNLDQSKIDFIKRKKIGYIIIETGAPIPKSFDPYIDKKIISEDYIFIQLKEHL